MSFGSAVRLRGSRVLVLLWICLSGLWGCAPRTAEDSGREAGGSPSASTRAARAFLALAASGDSAGLAAAASDSVVRKVLLARRHGGGEHMAAAAETMERTNVIRYESGSDVTFRYELRGTEYQGFVMLARNGDRLEVSGYGLIAKID